MKFKLILASASPRRKELLEQVGAEFEIIPAKGEEVIASRSPKQTVIALAQQKVQEVAASVSDVPSVILGADTVVAYKGEILGKPRDAADAKRMLRLLSGKTHSVFTGVALVINNGYGMVYSDFYEETKVTMYAIKKHQIEAYVRSGEPKDKAGAYGIQGKAAVYVKEIQGDYNNVVGLPVARVFQELEKSGIEIF